MKKNLLIALFAAVSIAPVAANAQAFVGATGGVAHQKATSVTGELKDHDTSFEFFGGYQFNKNFGLQGGYVLLNSLRTDADPTFTITPETAYLAGTYAFPITDKFSLTAKAGIASTRTELAAKAIKPQFHRHTSAVLGLGVSYVLTPSITAVAEYENFGKIVKDDTGTLKADNLAVGIRVSF